MDTDSDHVDEVPLRTLLDNLKESYMESTNKYYKSKMLNFKDRAETTHDTEIESEVESISPKEMSTSRALVPVNPEIKIDDMELPCIPENRSLVSNVSLNFVSVVNFNFDNTAYESLPNPRKSMEINYGGRSIDNRKIRLRDRRRNILDTIAYYKPPRTIVERNTTYVAYGKCRARIQEHRMRLAASTNNIETVENLLKAGINPNNQDFRGRSPLHLSACRGYSDIVRVLLQHNADPNRQDCIGNTPLHLATLTNKVPVVTLLLEAGAKVNTLDFRGFTPMYLAQTRLRLLQMCKCSDMNQVEKQMFEIVKMLRAYLKKFPSNNESSDWNAQMEKINDICSKLSLSAANKVVEVHDEVRTLLNSIEELNLS